MTRLCVAVLALALVAPAGAVLPRGKYGSWADEQHAWAIANGGPRLGADVWCGAGSGARDVRLCATEDGGKTWHRVLRYGPEVYNMSFTRANATHGVAVVDRLFSPYRRQILWTRDNGRRWYPIRGLTTLVVAGGALLFDVDRHLLRRATGWTSIRPRCSGFWAETPFARRAARGGNVCVGAPVATLRPRVVARLPRALLFGELQAVPGGVAALAGPHRGGTTHVYVHRATGRYLVRLPRSPERDEPRLAISFSYVSWPELELRTVFPSDSRRPPPWLQDDSITWRSSDGGRTWEVEFDDGGTRGSA